MRRFRERMTSGGKRVPALVVGEDKNKIRTVAAEPCLSGQQARSEAGQKIASGDWHRIANQSISFQRLRLKPVLADYLAGYFWKTVALPAASNSRTEYASLRGPS